MSKSGQSVLENVEGYDTTYIDTHLDQPVDMAVLLDGDDMKWTDWT